MSVTALLVPLGVGAEVTPATLRKMVQVTRKYKSDATTIMAARRITGAVAERNTRGNIDALQTWVRDNIRYVRDPRGLELIQTPPATLDLRTGDCDDKSVLLATLLETMGYQAGFCALGFNGAPFSHVIALVRLGQKWCPLETIIPGVGMGWCPPDATSHFMLAV